MAAPGGGNAALRAAAVAAARAGMVAQEAREPDAVLNIRALGLNPDRAMDAEHLELITPLYAEGMRAARRSVLLSLAASYLFPAQCITEEQTERFLGRATGRVKAMVDHMVSLWDEAGRPKTWVDALTPAQTAEYVAAKQRYSDSIRRSTRAVETAKEAYRQALSAELLSQATEREVLRATLRGFGVNDAPILGRDVDVARREGLADELRALDLADLAAVVVAPPQPPQA